MIITSFICDERIFAFFYIVFKFRWFRIAAISKYVLRFAKYVSKVELLSIRHRSRGRQGWWKAFFAIFESATRANRVTHDIAPNSKCFFMRKAVEFRRQIFTARARLAAEIPDSRRDAHRAPQRRDTVAYTRGISAMRTETPPTVQLRQKKKPCPQLDASKCVSDAVFAARTRICTCNTRPKPGKALIHFYENICTMFRDSGDSNIRRV